MSVTKGVSCSQFHYRTKPDGKIDAICLVCFLTVATAKSETELHEQESAHQCEGRLP
jgi:hypothetical protein